MQVSRKPSKRKYVAFVRSASVKRLTGNANLGHWLRED